MQVWKQCKSGGSLSTQSANNIAWSHKLYTSSRVIQPRKRIEAIKKHCRENPTELMRIQNTIAR